jgi:heptosyltransferase-3
MYRSKTRPISKENAQIFCLITPMTHNVLFIAPTRIGDAILASALLEHIRQRTPEARVTIIASPFSATLYSGYPNLEALHIIDKKRFSLHWWHIWKLAVLTQWSEIWDMRGSALAYLCATRKRYVFKSTASPTPKCRQYETQLDLPKLPYPTLWPQPQDINTSQSIVPSGEKIIAFAPCANFLGKEWPAEHFIALGQRMFGSILKGYRPMIVCAAHERERALPILKALEEFRPIDITNGESSLLTIYECFKRCRGFIGNDSGLMHMAAAAQIPTIGLFGPTDDITYQPVGPKADNIVAPERDLKKLQPQTVLERFVALVTPTEQH